MSGKKTPDLGAVRVGATRGEVELQLGAPVKSTTLDDKSRIDVYEYEVGNDPSAGRAAGHAALDVLTLGLWEIAGTPIEAFQGDKYTMTIFYDSNDKVVSINRSSPGSGTAEAAAKPDNSAKKEGETSTGSMVSQKLKELQDMQKAGLITEVEYTQQKAKILEGFSTK